MSLTFGLSHNFTNPGGTSVTYNLRLEARVSVFENAIIVLGDMNGDFNVTLADAGLLVEALTDRPAYDAHGFPVDADLNGDTDGSGTFDTGDLAAFNALLGGPSNAASVPEPSALLLALFALAAVTFRRRP
jgi:hypothetical protein